MTTAVPQVCDYYVGNGDRRVVYKFSPETFLGLHYSYWNVDNHFNGNTFAFDRHVAQLSLTQAFY